MTSTPPPPLTDSETDGPDFAAILDFLRTNRGFDFSAYKVSSLSRRVRRRMQLVGIDTYPEYLDYLQVHPDEFPQLFNVILINVTGFFRDPPSWARLARHVEQIVASKPDDAPIRVWSAGAASGEEPFTMAILLVEILGLEAFTRRVKIYATDVDEDALAQARLATYSIKAVEGVPPEILEKYFTRNATQYLFNKDLRRGVFFGRHDLLKDAPISRIDVLLCRNTLMYFNAEAQTRILTRLHFALTNDGVMMLGKAEMLLTHAALFTPLDLKLRLFSRVNRPAKVRPRPPEALVLAAQTEEGPGSLSRLSQTAFEQSPVAQVLLDASEHLRSANHKARSTFSLGPQDLGRPFHDLELSYRPAELRSRLDQARLERRTVLIKDIERVLPNGERRYFTIEVTPLLDEDDSYVGAQVNFADISEEHRLKRELGNVMLELETAHEELQSTSEELETTNEELQSTVEELETTNEELQSTNEELETMNEELQSSNEELQTMNDELRQRSDDFNQANVFLGTVLASLKCGVAVLDRDLSVRAWNYRMEDYWGLRADEVDGKHFQSLDIGLPIEKLRPALKACLAHEEHESETVLECMNRRGKTIQCKVRINALQSESIKGVIVLVEEV